MSDPFGRACQCPGIFLLVRAELLNVRCSTTRHRLMAWLHKENARQVVKAYNDKKQFPFLEMTDKSELVDYRFLFLR